MKVYLWFMWDFGEQLIKSYGANLIVEYIHYNCLFRADVGLAASWSYRERHAASGSASAAAIPPLYQTSLASESSRIVNPVKGDLKN